MAVSAAGGETEQVPALGLAHRAIGTVRGASGSRRRRIADRSSTLRRDCDGESAAPDPGSEDPGIGLAPSNSSKETTPQLTASRRARALARVSATRIRCGARKSSTLPGSASPMPSKRPISTSTTALTISESAVLLVGSDQDLGLDRLQSCFVGHAEEFGVGDGFLAVAGDPALRVRWAFMEGLLVRGRADRTTTSGSALRNRSPFREASEGVG